MILVEAQQRHPLGKAQQESSQMGKDKIYFIDFGWAGSRRGNPGYGPKCLGYKGPLAKIKPNSESKDKSKYKKKKHKSKRR